MKFNDFQTCNDIMKAAGWSSERRLEMMSLGLMAASGALGGIANMAMLRQQELETKWEKINQPFYRVYPSVVPMLLRINLSCDSSFVKSPFPALGISLPEDGVPELPGIRAILFGESPNMGPEGEDGITIWIDNNDRSIAYGLELGIHTWKNFFIKEGVTIEDAMEELRQERGEDATDIPQDILIKCVQLVVTLCMLDREDLNLINPVFLRKDATRGWDAVLQGDTESVNRWRDKCQRRAKRYGWEIGRRYETSGGMSKDWKVPPHPQGFWMGSESRGDRRLVVKTRAGWIKDHKTGDVKQIPVAKKDN